MAIVAARGAVTAGATAYGAANPVRATRCSARPRTTTGRSAKDILLVLCSGGNAADGGRGLSVGFLSSRATWAAMPYGGLRHRCAISRADREGAEQVERVASVAPEGCRWVSASIDARQAGVRRMVHPTIRRSAISGKRFKPDLRSPSVYTPSGMKSPLRRTMYCS